jgi:hypothetical protein
MQRADRATASMETVNADIDISRAHISAVQSSLDQLVQRGQGDVLSSFKAYSNDVEKLIQHGDRWTKNAEDMNKRGREYFAEWAKQDDAYVNPLIQRASEQRRAELGAVYDEIIAASQGVKEAMHTYISDHREAQTFLSNDLTTKGINAISPLIPKISQDGRNLSAALLRVQSAITRAENQMAHAGARIE